MTVRGFAFSTIFGFAIIVAIGIGFLANGNDLAGWFLLVVGCFFALATLILMWASKQHLVLGHAAELTGLVIARTPAGGATWSPSQQAWTWTGGGNVPGASFGRVNASMPLAVLEFRPTSLTLRFRPRLLTKGMFGVESPTWTHDDVVLIYPVRGRWFRFNRGLAITTTTTRSYFWTWTPAPILASLEREGYPVSWDERYLSLTS